jgi:uncharacterized protein (TIGR02996 family)
MPNTGDILERALLDNPDDIATHAAYADWLSQQGDPRGELIQVQLSLEEPNLAVAQERELKRREAQLLAQHAKTWLGDLGRFLVGTWSGADKPYHFEFRRGWLDLARMLPTPEAVIDALALAPQSRLLRRLEIVYDMRYHPFEFGQFTEGPKAALGPGDRSASEMYYECHIMQRLIYSTNLTNLRSFKLGYSDGDPLGHSTMVQPFRACNAAQVCALIKHCPRLEELYLNTAVGEGIDSIFALDELKQLRVLQYYFGSDY